MITIVTEFYLSVSFGQIKLNNATQTNWCQLVLAILGLAFKKIFKIIPKRVTLNRVYFHRLQQHDDDHGKPNFFGAIVLYEVTQNKFQCVSIIGLTFQKIA